MKLVTIQTMSAYNELKNNGYLITDSKYVNQLKYGVPYNFVINNMKNIENRYNAEYPLWAWVKYGRCTMPPKHKMLGFFAENDNEVVRITFNKPNSEVLVNDFVKYSFLLTNEYLPKTYNDYLTFDKYINSKNVSKNDLLAVVRKDKFNKVRSDNDFVEVNNKIQNSYCDIFNLETNYLQATVWDIKLSDIVKVEFIKKDQCSKRKTNRDFRKEYIAYLKHKSNNQ